MGDVRAFSKRQRWTEHEVAVLRAHYAAAPLDELLSMLPGRGARKIQCKANGLGLERQIAPRRTPEQVRQAKAQHMAAKRASNPEAHRAYQNEQRRKNRRAINAKVREQTAARLFWARALRLRNGITAFDLASIWRKQRGLCALTGRSMDRTAELDHKLPKARGGTDELDNLQWVTREANRAKRDLTDSEFLALCQDCARWIGRRIQIVEQIHAARKDAAGAKWKAGQWAEVE